MTIIVPFGFSVCLSLQSFLPPNGKILAGSDFLSLQKVTQTRTPVHLVDFSLGFQRDVREIHTNLSNISHLIPLF